MARLKSVILLLELVNKKFSGFLIIKKMKPDVYRSMYI